MKDLEQAGAENSTNLQAGRDLVYVGVSPEEVREIALDVFNRNFLELRGVAEDVALGRAEKVTTEFLTKMFADTPESVEQLRDPDVQRSVFNAQREFACSGEEDLGQVLVDLLIDRVKEVDRNLRTLALNEAILAAPKLTEGQRRAIAIVFLARYTRNAGMLGSARAVVDLRLRSTFQKLPVSTGALRPVDFQHIEYVGAGTVTMGEAPFGLIMREMQTSAFTNGFSEEQMPENLRESELRDRLLMPCMRDESKYQLRVAATQDLDGLIQETGAESIRESLVQAQEIGVLSGTEIESELRSVAPEFGALFDEWNSTSMKSVTLTSVGLAIGHAYWRRFGGDTPLNVWL